LAVTQESVFIKLGDHQTLHLRRIANQQPSGPVVLLIHGAVENGKIFYTHSNKGLAPFLAEQQPISEFKIVEMAQGQKVSRFIAWSYFDKATRKQICEELV